MDEKIKIDPTTYAYIGAFKAWYRLKYNKEYNLQEDEKEVFYKIRKTVLFEDFNGYLEEYERRKNNPTAACDYTYLQDAERKKQATGIKTLTGGAALVGQREGARLWLRV